MRSTRRFFTSEVRQADSSLLRSAKTIIYYWAPPRGFFTEVCQEDSLLLRSAKRIFTTEVQPRRFFTTEVRQADSSLLRSAKMFLYYSDPPKWFCSIQVCHEDAVQSQEVAGQQKSKNVYNQKFCESEVVMFETSNKAEPCINCA